MNFFGGGEEQKPQGPDPVFAGKSSNHSVKILYFYKPLGTRCTVYPIETSFRSIAFDIL